MKPTAYFLFFLSLLLAVSAVMLNQSSSPNGSANESVSAGSRTPSFLMIVLVAAAIGVAALGWAMLRYGGKGFSESNSPRVRN